MAASIWHELGLPDPDHVLEWEPDVRDGAIAQIKQAYAHLCDQNRPDAVLVVGDVNSSRAAAEVASSKGIALVHLEAGLRCFDPDMPEEENRIAIDHLADLLLTPSPDADSNLLAEGISATKIHQVGNIMIDTLVMMEEQIRQVNLTNQHGLTVKPTVVVTLHRPGNVDEANTLRRICDALCDIAKHHQVCWPIHPRTKHRLVQSDDLERLITAGIKVIDPLGYVAFGKLMRDARLVITDSGGVQEETSWLGIDCLTVRPMTERPVTTKYGTNQLVCYDQLVATALKRLERVPIEGNKNSGLAELPLWDGNTASRVIDVLERWLATDQV